jgi:hypothetical protein
MNGVFTVTYSAAETYLKYGGTHLMLRKAGFELKKYGFEDLGHFPFGVGWEGFESDEGRPNNLVERD